MVKCSSILLINQILNYLCCFSVLTGPLPQIEKDIKRTMTEVFKKTDEEFLKQAAKTKPSWKDGTTAIVVLVLQNILYISNLGDSKVSYLYI